MKILSTVSFHATETETEKKNIQLGKSLRIDLLKNTSFTVDLSFPDLLRSKNQYSSAHGAPTFVD